MNISRYLEDNRLRRFLIDTMWDWLQLNRVIDEHGQELDWECFDMGGIIPLARMFAVDSHWWEALDEGFRRCRTREEVEAWLVEVQRIADTGFSEIACRWVRKAA